MASRRLFIFLAYVNGCARGAQLLSTGDVHEASSAADLSSGIKFPDLSGFNPGRMLGDKASGTSDQRLHRDSEVEPTFCVNPYSEQSAWRALPQDPADVELNICAEGKQLPEFYLLGPPKCATTSLSLDLMATGIGVLGFDYRAENQTRAEASCSKEWHFFDEHMRRGHMRRGHMRRGHMALEKARQEWLAQMPTCQKERKVLADFTPSNLRWVPAPDNFVVTPVTPAGANLPQILHEWYGTQASAITFAVLLRRPLDRLHSMWHHAGMSRLSGAESFQGWIHTEMKEANAFSTYNESLWEVMYSLHLKGWLEHFNASQFVVIPFRLYVAGDKDLACKAISKTMRYQMNCDSEGRPAAEGKHHDDTPRLGEETTDLFQIRFDHFMETETGRLVDLITSMHSQGAALPGYDGSEGDRAATQAWLLNDW